MEQTDPTRSRPVSYTFVSRTSDISYVYLLDPSSFHRRFFFIYYDNIFIFFSLFYWNIFFQNVFFHSLFLQRQNSPLFSLVFVPALLAFLLDSVGSVGE